MDKRGQSEAAAKFISALIKSMQTLCHGYLEFQSGIEIIGHINVSVDKASSLDYVLKEKVCRNHENSTMFVSDTFRAEAKAEELALRKLQCAEQTAMIQQTEGRLSSALSSITSSLAGPRSRNARKGPNKRRSSQDHSSNAQPTKMSHMESSPRGSGGGGGSSPGRSRTSLQTVTVTDGGTTTETLLPQTAGLGEGGGGLGVNLAASVLESVANQNDSDLHRDDDSDNDLEVTFIKEEYGSHGDGSTPDFDPASDNQFVHRGFMPGAFDPGQFPGGEGGPQPGPSGMRGVSGIQTFVNSLTAFGPLGGPGLALPPMGPGGGGRGRGGRGGSSSPRGGKGQTSLQRAFALHREDKRKKQEGASMTEEELKQRLELMTELLSLKGISSTQDYKAALVREKRRLAKKLYRATLPEEKKSIIKEKDKIHKRLKRATRWAASESMGEGMGGENVGDNLGEGLGDSTQHFSDTSSDISPQKDFEGMPPRSSAEFPPRSSSDFTPRSSTEFPARSGGSDFPAAKSSGAEFPPRTTLEFPPRSVSEFPPSSTSEFSPRGSSDFPGSFAAVGSVSLGSQDKDHGGQGGSRQGGGGESPRMSLKPSPGPGPGSVDSMPAMTSDSLACDLGGPPPPINVGRGVGPGGFGMPRMCVSSTPSHVGVGTDPMDSFAGIRPGLGPGMVFGAVGNMPWMDPVAFNTAQEHRHLDHDQREAGYGLMKLGQR